MFTYYLLFASFYRNIIKQHELVTSFYLLIYMFLSQFYTKMFCLFFGLLGRFGGKTDNHDEEVKKAVEYIQIFQNEPTRLCKIDKSGNLAYHQYVQEFLSFVRSSSLNDPEYIKHLERYQPRPFDKIRSMDYQGLRALLTLITNGEAMSGRKDYICKIIEKGYIVNILQRLRELAL